MVIDRNSYLDWLKNIGLTKERIGQSFMNTLLPHESWPELFYADTKEATFIIGQAFLSGKLTLSD